MLLFTRDENDRTRQWNKIHPSHAAYMPLCYPLLFPHGEPGWTWSRRLTNPEDNSFTDQNLTQQMWFRFQGYARTNQPGILRHVRRLAQRYIVDAYAIIDQNRLDWLRRHQSNLRADLYNGLADVLHTDDANADSLGRRVVLPASYTGGDRFMSTLYQNSMAIMRHFGKPTLFVTMTANPKWVDLTRTIPQGADAMDDPMLAATIFNLKRKALIEDLKKHFGNYLGISWTVEYQKRVYRTVISYCFLIVTSVIWIPR